MLTPNWTNTRALALNTPVTDGDISGFPIGDDFKISRTCVLPNPGSIASVRFLVKRNWDDADVDAIIDVTIADTDLEGDSGFISDDGASAHTAAFYFNVDGGDFDACISGRKYYYWIIAVNDTGSQFTPEYGFLSFTGQRRSVSDV